MNNKILFSLVVFYKAVSNILEYFSLRRNREVRAHHQWLKAIAENVMRDTLLKGQITS